MAKGENLDTAKAVTVVNENAKGVMVAGTEYKVIENVTVPILKHDSNEVVAVKIVQPIEEQDQFDTKIDDETGEVLSQKFKGKINVGRVIELGSGQLMQYVFNAISASEIKSAYPEHSYVGKSFAIKKLGVVAGKRYKEVQIIEIEAA